MGNTLLLVYVLLLGISLCISEEAKLLLYKKLETTPPVELEDMIISYNIINTGDGPAYNIEVTDTYQRSSFEVSSIKPEGDLIILNIDEIAPQESKSINVTVIPRVHGLYHPDKARIKYSGGADIELETEDDEEDNEIEVDLDSEDPQEVEKVVETGRIGYSNHMLDIEIQDSKSY